MTWKNCSKGEFPFPTAGSCGENQADQEHPATKTTLYFPVQMFSYACSTSTKEHCFSVWALNSLVSYTVSVHQHLADQNRNMAIRSTQHHRPLQARVSTHPSTNALTPYIFRSHHFRIAIAVWCARAATCYAPFYKMILYRSISQHQNVYVLSIFKYLWVLCIPSRDSELLGGNNVCHLRDDQRDT